MLIEWKDECSVGRKELDDQHKRLINYINKLHGAISVGKGKDVIDDILDALLEFTYEHFSAEENLMKLHHFPGFDEHKKEHDRINNKVIELQEKSAQKDDYITMPLQLMEFLNGWLVDHILVMDKQYAPYLKEEIVDR